MHAPADLGSTAGPVDPGERVAGIDILRGFALFGVVLINVQWMIDWAGFSTGVDGVTVDLLELLVLGKFFRLFAFLFGLGFALQMLRLEARGVRFVPLYLRRLGILFLFGVAHGVLFWPEDVLAAYAQLALLLFFFRRSSARTIMIAIVASLVAFHLYHYTVFVIEDLSPPASAQELAAQSQQREVEAQAREAEEVRIRSGGTVPEVVAWNARFFVGWRLSISSQLGLLAEEFVMFLLGLYVGRRRILENVSSNLPFLRRTMWWGLTLGVVGFVVSRALDAPYTGTWPSRLTRGAMILSEDVGLASLTVFYASGLTLLLQRARWARRLAPLGAVGRTALTNYVLQSVLITTVFYDYGLGLYGRVSPSAGVGLATVVFALQIAFSVWWLRRFRFGPGEWLWRSMTYGKPQRLLAR